MIDKIVGTSLSLVAVANFVIVPSRLDYRVDALPAEGPLAVVTDVAIIWCHT
jgi:hypothetical protein